MIPRTSFKVLFSFEYSWVKIGRKRSQSSAVGGLLGIILDVSIAVLWDSVIWGFSSHKLFHDSSKLSLSLILLPREEFDDIHWSLGQNGANTWRMEIVWNWRLSLTARLQANIDIQVNIPRHLRNSILEDDREYLYRFKETSFNSCGGGDSRIVKRYKAYTHLASQTTKVLRMWTSEGASMQPEVAFWRGS